MHGLSGAWAHGILEDLEENFDGNFVRDIPRPVELGTKWVAIHCITQVCGLTLPTCVVFISVSPGANGCQKILQIPEVDFVVAVGRHLSRAGSRRAGEDVRVLK